VYASRGKLTAETVATEEEEEVAVEVPVPRIGA
jgi:hypothetical protein